MNNIATYIYSKFRVLLFKIPIKPKQDRQCMYNVTNEVRSRNHCCRRKTISITYSECVVSVVLFLQHAKRMRPVVRSFVASLAAPHFAI
jgi:hypothetical protein